MHSDPVLTRRRGFHRLRMATASVVAAAVIGTGGLTWFIGAAESTAATASGTSTSESGSSTTTSGSTTTDSSSSTTLGSSASEDADASSGGS